ncbi:hypothetical protein EYF80_038400 [Liparis tanakae]|uniref:Uncharacterized protein n=1 Tax=Liparis tanakae TaxID=230148 RepID=A0A4Z2GCY7_9TELE|nr:hypothetical protein EYF80_038400 [Liparis tanakae]
MCCDALGKAVLYCGAESSGPCGATWLSTIMTGRWGYILFDMRKRLVFLLLRREHPMVSGCERASRMRSGEITKKTRALPRGFMSREMDSCACWTHLKPTASVAGIDACRLE